MRPRTAAALGLLGALLAPSCKTPEWAMYNLRETHHFDGGVKRVGQALGPMEYVFIIGLRDVNLQLGGLEEEVQLQSDTAIDDPLGLTLDALVVLDEYDGDDPWTRGLTVEAFAWLAVDDEYVLARERAVLGLGGAGRWLGLDEGPRLLPEGTSPAGPDEVVASVSALLRASRAEVDVAQGRAPDEAAPSMAQACADAAALTLDRDGARRLLAVCNSIHGIASLTSAELTELETLALDLQRRCVRLSLAEAFGDPDGAVRAAALRASVECTDNGVPALLRQAFGDPDDRVVLEVVHLVQEYGLPPAPEELTAEETAVYVDAWIGDLVLRTLDRDPRIGAAACKALSLHAGGDLWSLRPEDWQAWERRRHEVGP